MNNAEQNGSLPGQGIGGKINGSRKNRQ